MPDPKTIRINVKKPSTYAGGSVRFTTEQSAEITTARIANQQALKQKITPSADPIGDIIQEVQNPSKVRGALPQGSETAYNWLKNRAQSSAIGDQVGYGRSLKVEDGMLGLQELQSSRASGQAYHPFLQDMRVINFDIAVTPLAQPYAKTRILAHELGHTLLKHPDINVGQNQPLGGMEAEADTISYGVKNRLYPWNRRSKAETGKYVQAIQADIDPSGKSFHSVDPIEHLQQPEVRTRVNDAINSIAPNPRQPFKTMLPGVYGSESAFPAPPLAAPAPAEVTALRLKQQTLSPRDLATNAPQSSGVFEGKQLVDSFRINQPGRRNAGGFTVSSDSGLNSQLQSGVSGGSGSSAFRDQPRPLLMRDFNAKPPVGDRLLTAPEIDAASSSGEHLGLGFNHSPVKPQTPLQVKFGASVDYLKKGLIGPDTFIGKVNQMGGGNLLEATKNLGQTLYGSRGGGDMHSTTLGYDVKLPGRGQGSIVTPSGSVAPPTLDQTVKGLGYRLKTPDQTGLPFPVAADPQTGEMVTVKGKPLPPNVQTPAGNSYQLGGNSRSSGKSPFVHGFETSTGTATTGTKSFLQPTRDLTQGMSLGDRAKFAAGRLAGDVASDATRINWWANNHPLAMARKGFTAIAGGNKIAGSLAAFTGIQAFGQASNQFDLTNPGQAFRPKGFSAAYPVNDQDKRQVGNPVRELIGRYIGGKGGNLLPYDQFKQERPDVSREEYQHYDQYLKGGGSKPMPAGDIDVGGLGIIKATSHGINGPEVRLAGFSATPLGVGAGTATAVGTASLFNPKLRGPALQGLGVVGAGLDFNNRLQQGQSVLQAGKGTAVTTAAAVKGAQYGAALGARGGPVGAVVGGLVGGVAGGVLGNAATDSVDAKANEIRQVAASGKADPISRFLGATPLGQLAMKMLPGGNQSKEGQPQQPQSDGDRVEQLGKDRLLEASAKFKLQRQPDGLIKSVPNTDGANVRGEITKVNDGDSYDVRTFNSVTGQFETKNVRLAGADTRETADHDSSGGFINRMIGKQIKDQGFADKNAVFVQGEKDKQAAAKLLPVGSTPYVNRTGESTHDRPVVNVGSESGGKDVGQTLIAEGNAVAFEKKSGSSGGGGQSDASREKVANLQYGEGGQGDRNNQSKERIATQGNQTKLANTQLQNQGRLENTDLQGRYKVATADTQGRWKYATSTDTAKINVGGKIAVAQIGFQGKQLQYGLGGSIDRTNTSKEKIADVTTARKLQGVDLTSGRKLQGDVYKADQKLRSDDLTSGRRLQGTVYAADQKLQGTAYTADQKLRGTAYTADQKVAQEGVKQSGAGNVAQIKAGAQIGAAQIGADAKVRVADIGASVKLQTSAMQTQQKAESEGQKALASYMGNMNKSLATAAAESDKARIARLRTLGVY